MIPRTYPIRENFFLNSPEAQYYLRTPQKIRTTSTLAAIHAVHVHARALSYAQFPETAKKDLGNLFRPSIPYKPILANGLIAGCATIAVSAILLAVLIIKYIALPWTSLLIVIPLAIAFALLFMISIIVLMKYIAYKSFSNATRHHIAAIVEKAHTLCPEHLLKVTHKIIENKASIKIIDNKRKTTEPLNATWIPIIIPNDICQEELKEIP